jgi:hypothetical protein
LAWSDPKRGPQEGTAVPAGRLEARVRRSFVQGKIKTVTVFLYFDKQGPYKIERLSAGTTTARTIHGLDHIDEGLHGQGLRYNNGQNGPNGHMGTQRHVLP